MAFGKKTYDSETARGNYAKFRSLRENDCNDLFGGFCFVCGSIQDSHIYHLHHVNYGVCYPRNSHASQAGLQDADIISLPRRML
jgi:hypothetical protein